MARIFTYSFEDCSVTFNHPQYGVYSAYGTGMGTFTISFSNNVVAHEVSADLSVVISKHVYKNGTLTMNVLQSSDFNNWLRGWANYLEAPTTDNSEFALTDITIRSKSTGDVYYLTGCTHQKIADQDFQDEAQFRQWTIMAANIVNSEI